MTDTYHYPPDLFQLLVDTISRLFRGKKDVVLFFRGAGVPLPLLYDVEERVRVDPKSIGKAEIARTILQRINERGDIALRERREVIRRVVEFDDFSSCWPDDRLPAQGLVARVRETVNVKDSFTRMKQEKEKEQRVHREKKEAEASEARRRHDELNGIKTELYALSVPGNPQERGKRFEEAINKLFRHYGILVRESFSRYGDLGEGTIEQIDGT
jgi:restriction system protein